MREPTRSEKLRRKKGQVPREEVIKLKCVLEYQRGMGGVDLQDQVTALFPIMRRTVKGYRKIFFYLMDMCMFNAFILYHKITGEKKNSYTVFRLSIAEQLLQLVEMPEYSVRGRPSGSASPFCLQAKTWAHLPMHVPQPKKKEKRFKKMCSVLQ